MSKLPILTATLAAVALAASAAANAGGPRWSPSAVKPATSKESTTAVTQKTAAPAIVNGFEYVGGDPGWQPAQHRYVFSGGKFAHSQECDHEMHAAAAAPTMDELERIRRLYPSG